MTSRHDRDAESLGLNDAFRHEPDLGILPDRFDILVRKLREEIHHAHDNERVIPNFLGLGMDVYAVPTLYIDACIEGALREETHGLMSEQRSTPSGDGRLDGYIFAGIVTLSILVGVAAAVITWAVHR